MTGLGARVLDCGFGVRVVGSSMLFGVRVVGFSMLLQNTVQQGLVHSESKNLDQ